MADPDFQIPADLQPDQDDFSFDLRQTLNAIVGLRSFIPDDAYTAQTLGTEREGSGVVINESGLIATIGYLVPEAETIWINTNDGRAIPGHALAYDQETGFGLVQALGKLELPALEIGDSDQLSRGDRCILAGSGGRQQAIKNRIVARQDFAGYWEYALDDALFTSPPHPVWGGTGLIGEEGKLLGIGSLIIQRGNEGGRHDMNMVVPISLLSAILPDLTSYGRVDRPPRPWLGMFATESEDAVVVAGVADSGPAAKAGVRAGDEILAVDGGDVNDLGMMWRQIWATGVAGTEVRLKLQRGSNVINLPVSSADRASYLKAPKFH